MAGKAMTIELSDEEIEVLVRLLRKQRNTMPSYLLSKKREAEILDALLEKLS